MLKAYATTPSNNPSFNGFQVSMAELSKHTLYKHTGALKRWKYLVSISSVLGMALKAISIYPSHQSYNLGPFIHFHSHYAVEEIKAQRIKEHA